MNRRCARVSLALLTLVSIAPRAVAAADEAILLTVAVAPDGRTLASGYADGVIRLWSLPDGEGVRGLYHRGGVTALAFSPDGKRLASLGGDRSVRVWDWTESKVLHKFAEEGRLCLTFTGDGKRLAAAGKDAVVVWDLTTGKETDRLAGATGDTLALTSTADGQTLVSASGAGVIQVWDLVKGKLVREMEHEAGVCSVAVAPDGAILAAGDASGKIRLWDLATGEQKRELKLRQACVSLAFAADGKILAASCGAAVVRFDVAGGRDLKAWPGFRNALVPITFDAGSRALAGSADPLPKMWDLAASERARRPLGLKLAPADFQDAWDEMVVDNVGRALDAELPLTLDPDGAVAFLKERLGPEPPIPALAGLIADLDHTEFAKRQAAMEQLHRLGRDALPELRKAAEAKPALEVRQRLDELVALIQRQEFPPDYRRNLRGVVLLGRMGTPQARKILEAVAGGAAVSPVTRKAWEALREIDGLKEPSKEPIEEP